MLYSRFQSLVGQVSLYALLVIFASGSAHAQSIVSDDVSSSNGAALSESSSLQPSTAASAALPAAPTPAQYGEGRNGGGYPSHNRFSHITFEAGGGFNAPSSDSSNYITWGGNFTIGAGYRLTDRLSMLADYQFIDDKLPGAIIAETGATGGNAHIWSLTLNPEFDLFPKASNDIYLTGGGGFYRKVTNFTNPEETLYCDYFYCEPGYANEVVGHFSSNQGGWSVGAGYQHRMGGMYHDSKMKLFAEVRYLDILTPATQTSPNGLGVTTVGEDTKLIPVTFGLRW